MARSYDLINNEGFNAFMLLGEEFEKPPSRAFLYCPRRANDFSLQGERMVGHLTSVGGAAYDKFNSLIDLEEQRDIATRMFLTLQDSKHNKPGTKGNPGYFRTKRNFSNLVPEFYRRTENAPRLTTSGNTFHGMNKILFSEIVKELTLLNKCMLVAEIDMSACHSRIAASLANKGNILDVALMEPNFWNSQVQAFMPLYFNKGIEIDKKVLERL